MTDGRVDHRATVALGAAVVAAVVVGLTLGLVPASTESVTTSAAPGQSEVTTYESSSSTLVESEGASVLIVFAVPVVIAAVALAVRTRRASLVAGVLTAVCCVLGMMTIGLFYVPVPILLFLAARLQRAGDQDAVDSRQYAA